VQNQEIGRGLKNSISEKIFSWRRLFGFRLKHPQLFFKWHDGSLKIKGKR
jgi:hypothetical protein